MSVPVRDVAVIGAGPAGLAMALMLARQGRRVVMHERFETPRPVGALDRHADLDTALSAYVASRRAHVRLYQALSLAFTPFYQADGRALPWGRDHVLGRVARLPLADQLLAATVGGLLLAPRR